MTVQVTVNAQRHQIIGVVDDVLKIKLHALPIEGRANQALIQYLSEVLKIPKVKLVIVQGKTSRRKVVDVLVPDIDKESIVEKVEAAFKA